MGLVIGSAIFIVILLVLFGIMRKMGGGSFPWVHFYAKGKESGFSFNEVNMLRKVAVENRLQDPTSLFWSIKQLDRSIKGTIIKLRSENKIDIEPYSSFLSKLFDFRRSVELNLPKYKLGIKNTNKLVARQMLKITIPGIGTYASQIVEVLRRYIAVSYPEGPKLPQGFTWKGQRINVYFWRQDDAGYVFESKVLEDFIEKKYPILHMAHSDSVVRSQRRGSVRVDLAKAAYLYPLKDIREGNELEETKPGLRCRMKDLSEEGAAVLVGGQAKVGMPVKLQFKLVEKPVVMCGIVRGVTFNPKQNQSILHIQSPPPSPRMKNIILSYVYNLFGERERDEKMNPSGMAPRRVGGIRG